MTLCGRQRDARSRRQNNSNILSRRSRFAIKCLTNTQKVAVAIDRLMCGIIAANETLSPLERNSSPVFYRGILRVRRYLDLAWNYLANY